MANGSVIKKIKKGGLTKSTPCVIIVIEREVRKMNKKKKINKSMFKMEGEELQQYLHFRKRGSVVENKKGKGAYKRNKKWGDENE